MDAFKNFSYSVVAVAPTPATTGLSLTVQDSHGTRFPTPPFNCVVCPPNTLPTPANAEIIRVSAIVGDQFTITRGEESSTPRSIQVADQIYAAITKKTFDDIAAAQVLTALWRYSADLSVVDAYPGAGDVRWNNATQIAATELRVAHLTADGLDIDIFLALIKAQQHVHVQDRNLSTHYQLWHVDGPPTQAGVDPDFYWKIPVTLHGSGGQGTTGFSGGQALFIAVIP